MRLGAWTIGNLLLRPFGPDGITRASAPRAFPFEPQAREVTLSKLRTLATAAVILAAIAAPAQAGCGRIWMPPEQYHKPVTVPVLLVRMPWREVQPFCLSHGVSADLAEGRMWACTYRTSAGNYVMALSDDFTAEEQACMVIHEKAHMPPNNWPANHPGRRFD
jgi:hypothetical protein